LGSVKQTGARESVGEIAGEAVEWLAEQPTAAMEPPEPEESRSHSELGWVWVRESGWLRVGETGDGSAVLAEMGIIQALVLAQNWIDRAAASVVLQYATQSTEIMRVA
jgi:hypothetical protein